MDISSVNSDLIRGNATTIILSSLWSNDRYGYEILQEIDEKSQGQYKLKQATLYNQLKKLEKAGLISSYEGAPDDTGGGRRRYYSLTAEGRAFLSKEKREYEYSRTILDKLVSEEEFDLASPAPFDTENLRPYTKTGEEEEKPKIVYKEKIIEKPVEVEVIKEVEVEKVVEKV
ncbi:MAG: PadR family transcriptional regulator, partial [Clostridia bacterium]|nr:PadR family transcriptional regulator [Clostridia bacterium]